MGQNRSHDLNKTLIRGGGREWRIQQKWHNKAVKSIQRMKIFIFYFTLRTPDGEQYKNISPRFFYAPEFLSFITHSWGPLVLTLNISSRFREFLNNDVTLLVRLSVRSLPRLELKRLKIETGTFGVLREPPL